MLRNLRYVAHIAGIGPRILHRIPPHDFPKYHLCLTTFRSNSSDSCKPPQPPPCPPPPQSTQCPPPPQPPPCPPKKPLECRDTKKQPPPREVCPQDDGSKKKYTRQLIGGLIFAAISLFTLYHFLHQRKPDKEVSRKPKKRKSKPVIKCPPDSKDIPTCVPYLLIGGGTAAFSAFRSIKSSDPTAKVLIISNENCYPYMRPPLSKELWFNEDDEVSKKLLFKQWNGTERSLFYEPEDFYVDCKCLMEQSNGGVAVARGWTVEKVDSIEKKAYLEDGHEIKFRRCLIATGASPKNLPIFENASDAIQEKVTLFRDVFDFEELHTKLHSGGTKSVAVVGGGFLGTELACALARHGCKAGVKVQQIFPESGVLGKILPEYLSRWTMAKVKAEGVNVIPNANITDVGMDQGQLVLKLSNGQSVKADHVVVAVGVKPNTELAGPSGLEVDPQLGGFLVNAEMLARSNVWAAGDCTCFYDVKFGRRRVEHHDHAVVSGRLAGENMTGAGKPYWHQSMFWSDLGPDVGFEAIGIIDSNLPTVGVYAKPCDDNTSEAKLSNVDEQNKGGDKMPPPATVSPPAAPKEGESYDKGIIFYLRDDTVVGIILWNVFNRMSTARQVLKDESKYDDLNEVAKLFNIHED